MLLQNKLTAAVFLVSRFIVSRIHRSVLTETDSIDARGINAEPNQLLPQGQSAAFAQRAVVFFRSARIAMTFDFQRVRRMSFDVIGDGSDFRLFFAAENRTVVVEMDCVR